MNFRDLIKKLIIPYLDINRYQTSNRDVDKNYSRHYLDHGFGEARPAYFHKQKEGESELVPAVEIQHLRSQKLPSVSMITELFNGTPSPCSYIRLIFPLQYLDFLNEINLEDDISSNKIWALNRIPCFPLGMEAWIDSLKPNDRIIYDIDDDLISHYGKSSDQAKLIMSMILLADRVTVSTKALYKIAVKFNKNTIVRNNFCLLDLTSKQSDFKDEFSILYMGTSTHAEDFKFICDALLVMADKYPNIKFNIIGLDDLPNNKLFNNLKITTSYYPQFIEKYRNIGTFKIGIIPLLENSINTAKSNIKYYDCLNICEHILCSNVGEYVNSKLPRLTIVKSNIQSEWIKEIEKLVMLPNISQEELNKSYINARNIKFNELAKLSNIINSMFLIKERKTIKYEKVNSFLSESELHTIFVKRFTAGKGCNLSNFKSDPGLSKLLNMIDGMDYLFIEDFMYLNVPLKVLITKIMGMKREFNLVINVIKYDKNNSRKSDAINSSNKNVHLNDLECSENIKNNGVSIFISDLYKDNLDYLARLSKENFHKSLTEIKFKNYDALFISF